MSIEVSKINIDSSAFSTWADTHLRPKLTPDISGYARGRQRLWLGMEAPLNKEGAPKPAYMNQALTARLRELINWDFDYCLISYSGDINPVGIEPHRDAGSLSYEAYGLNITSTCEFQYWEQRKGFRPGPASGNPLTGPPSHVIRMTPGMLIRFNSKNPHAAIPAIQRWGINFWKVKNV